MTKVSGICEVNRSCNRVLLYVPVIVCNNCADALRCAPVHHHIVFLQIDLVGVSKVSIHLLPFDFKKLVLP